MKIPPISVRRPDQSGVLIPAIVCIAIVVGASGIALLTGHTGANATSEEWGLGPLTIFTSLLLCCFLLWSFSFGLDKNLLIPNMIFIAASLLVILPCAGTLTSAWDNEVSVNLKNSVIPGWRGPQEFPTALALTLFVGALNLLRFNNGFAQQTARTALFLVSAIGFTAMLGNLYGIKPFSAFYFFRPMHSDTAAVIMLLAIGAGKIGPADKGGLRQQNSDLSGVASFKSKTWIILLIVLLGYLRLQSNKLKLFPDDIGIGLLTISFAACALLIFRIANNRLKHIDERRRLTEDSLRELTISLESAVQDRTKEISDISTRLTLATKGANIGVWDWNMMDDRIFWDDQMFLLYDVQWEEGLDFYGIWEKSLHPDDLERCRAAMAGFREHSDAFDLEFRVVMKDKSIRYLKSTAVVYRNKYGDPERMIGTNWDVTEHKTQLEKIRRSEELHQKMVTAVQDYAIILLDEKGNIQSWNIGAERIKGYKDVEIIGKSFTSFYTEEDRLAQHPERLLETARREGKVTEESWRVRKDGSLFWGNVLITALYDDDGSVIGFTKVTRDLTMVRAHEEEQKRQQKRFEGIFNSAHQFIGLLSTDGILLEANRTALQFGGLEESDVIGKPLWECYWCRGSEAVFKHACERAAAGEFVRENVRIKGQNDTTAWVDFTLKPIYNEQGNISFIIPEGRDITGQITLQTLNKEQEEKIRLFVKHTPAAVAMFDKDMNYLLASDRWYSDYGLEGQNIIGRCHYDIFPEIRKMQEWLDIHNRCLAGETAMKDEDSFLRSNGNQEWMHWEIHPWKKDGGAIGGIIMFTEVITEKVLARERLLSMNEKLEESNSELEQFAYVASHDLQEPLRMVSSFLQLLDKKYKPQLDDTAAQYIYFAVDGAERMKTLIKDLLAFSRIGTVKQELEIVETVEIVEEIKKVLKTAIEESNAVILCNGEMEMKADSFQIKQVFQNLIGNAIKYTGDTRPVINIESVSEPNFWHISIRDNGIGIDPKYFEKIFVVFQRLHTKSAYSGTGIGLAICKKIVEKHGGKIWVESSVGSGSTFHFTISKN